MIFRDDIHKMTLRTNEQALGPELDEPTIMVQKNEMPKRSFLQSLKSGVDPNKTHSNTIIGLTRNRNAAKTLVEFDMNYGLNRTRGSVLQK